MTTEQMSELESAVNKKIRDGIAVTPILYHDKDDPELLKVRSLWELLHLKHTPSFLYFNHFIDCFF